jgi:calcineurin-like phosphoesterase
MMVEGRNGHRVLVVNALGRVFMQPADDPFRAVEAAIAAAPLGEVVDAIIVDFHTEATSEIQGMGFFLDGKATLVVGTHTHIPTSDQRILRGGTALMADAGMCGDFDSIIGVDAEEPLNRFLTGIPNGRFTPAEGEATLCGVAVETDPKTGLARKVLPVRIGGTLNQAFPDF